MNREALLLGTITLAFGLGSYQLHGEAGGFAIAHMVIGCGALLFAAVITLRNARSVGRAFRLESVYRIAIGGLVLTGVVVLAERLAAHSEVRFDLTFEGEFQLAPATREALSRLEGPVALTLYHDPGDPRIRRTRLLLEEIGRGHDVTIHTRLIEDSPEAEDRFAIASSNTVVIEHGDDWDRVDRPTEGALFEAFAKLGRRGESILYISTGSGEGDIEDGSQAGFSGLAVGFQTEGFDVRTLPSAVMNEIPPDADLVAVIGPQRNMRSDALAALRKYVEGGGSLLSFIEPGVESGLEGMLAGFGLQSPDALVIDPISDPVDGEIAGLSPIVFNYAPHPVTQGLQRNRNTVFRRARSFTLRKPQPQDDLKAVVYTSPHAWLHEGPLPIGSREPPPMRAGQEPRYIRLAVAARYPRGDHEGRIVAFGDRDFASNRYLRALYNLDLVMNAAQWAVERTDRITLRPKSAGLIQFPVPIANSMKAFYGVGLLIPEVLLVLGGITWLRQRQS
ncbi:MAG: Gldg family protein [Deltaproteobacteria bacterium]|nr:Gldg family protein [Deltaproteobacteria bacterium]